MNVRTQILADQAIRAEGEQHTANTVRAAIRYTFFENRATFQALTAEGQRSLWGAAPFGRRQVRHDAARGGFVVRRIVGFGMDFHDVLWTYAEVAALLNKGQTVVGKRD